MTSPLYIPDDRFERLARDAALKLNPAAGEYEINEVRISLCEVGNIWPLSIALDAGLAGSQQVAYREANPEK
ncbi:hypothetical protein AB0L20_31995 [Streptomyces albidoflavus]|uniref:hypothetical protein n=1 Tax=Streptomyces albidoflavus TaxID=1886 RepID=UPI00341CE9B6